MNESNKQLIIWTVEWEERKKPSCHVCCSDDEHPWTKKREVFSTNNGAYNHELGLYDMKDSGNYTWEIRNIKTYTGVVALQETYLLEIPRSAGDSIA